MATERQKLANQRNAQRSTGPRTAAGKAASRLNALKHGILAEQVILPDEDPAEFATFRAHVSAELEPIGELEELQADLVVAYAWRLRRVMRIEKGIFITEVYGELLREARAEASSRVSYPESWEILVQDVGRGKAVIDDPAAHEAALARQRELRDVVYSNDGRLGAAFIRDATKTDALSKLARYEAHIQRSLVRAVDELRNLQTIRIETGEADANSAVLELEPKRPVPTREALS